MPNFSGSCLCGEIKFAVNGPIGSLVHCHCSRCRKWHGSAYRSRVVVRVSDFTWLQGKSALSYYESTPNVTKTFCSKCGSNLITIYQKKPDIYGVPVGGLEGDFGQPESFHVFVGSKAAWHKITDELEQFEELPHDSERIHRICI